MARSLKEKQEPRRVIRCDAGDGKIIKVYKQLNEMAHDMDLSNMSAYYRIRNEKPIAGELYLYEETFIKKFPKAAREAGFIHDDPQPQLDEIEYEGQAQCSEPEEDKTEVADMKKDEISEQADKQTSEPATDMVNHPPHYCTGDIECWDAMVSAFGPEWMRAYATVTAFKYIWRAKHKGRFAEDMKKAAWYEARAAELEERICTK